jgi:hypothetical protein
VIRPIYGTAAWEAEVLAEHAAPVPPPSANLPDLAPVVEAYRARALALRDELAELRPHLDRLRAATGQDTDADAIRAALSALSARLRS